MSTTLMTAEELARLPDDGHRYDLIRGELICMAPAGGEHGEIASELGAELRDFVRAHKLGRTYGAETGFLLARNPDVVMGPDAAFIRADRVPPRSLRCGYVPVAPDLTVEIVSPWDRRRDVMRKVEAYLVAGVRLVWVIDPRRRVTAYRAGGTTRVFTEQDDLDGEDVLPGFRLPVTEIFRDE